MYIEVPDEATFDFLNAEIKRLIENEPMNQWAAKLFGNGSGGYYMPAPTGARRVEGMDELLGGYPTYESLPQASPPGSYEALSTSNDIEFDTDDFVNHGKLSTGQVLSDVDLLETPSGDKYILTYYRGGQITVTDLSDGSYWYFNPGVFFPRKPTYHEPTNSIIFFAAGTIQVIRFSLTSGELEFVSDPQESPNPNDGIQSRCISPDGYVYFGSTLAACVWKYDPSTDVITPLGQLHVDNSVTTYVYHIGADETHVYAGLRNSGDYWLVIVDISTGTTEVVGLGDRYRSMFLHMRYSSPTDTYFHIVQLYNSATGKPMITSKYKNGQISSLPDSADVYETIQNGYLGFWTAITGDWPSKFGVEVDLSDIIGISGIATLKYKHLEDEDFTVVAFTEVVLGNFTVKVFNAFGNKVFGAFANYAPVFIYDTETDTIEQINDHPASSTHNVYKYDDNIAFIGGYANDTREWQFNQPWGIDSSDEFGVGSNPRRIDLGLSNAYYHYYHTKGSNGWLYCFWERVRNDVGSGVSWYDPSTGTIEKAGSSLIAELKNYRVASMVTINNGDTLVLLTTPRGSAILPRVFIFDISVEHNLNNISPVTKDLPFLNKSAGIAFDGGSNTVVGFVDNIVWKLNITDLNNPVIRNTPAWLGPLSSNRCVAQDADGYIWFLARVSSVTKLYRLNPVDMTALVKSGDLGSDVHNRSITITASGKLYLIGGSNSISEFSGSRSPYYLESLQLNL
jgi:hypothetical protein